MLLKRFSSALLLSASPRPPTPDPALELYIPSCSACFRFWFKNHLSSGVLPWPSYLKIQLHPSSYYILLPCFIVIEQMISLIIYFVHWAALTLEWRCLEGRHFSVLFTLCLQWQISACTQSIRAVRMNPQPWWQHLSRSLCSHKKKSQHLLFGGITTDRTSTVIKWENWGSEKQTFCRSYFPFRLALHKSKPSKNVLLLFNSI